MTKRSQSDSREIAEIESRPRWRALQLAMVLGRQLPQCFGAVERLKLLAMCEDEVLPWCHSPDEEFLLEGDDDDSSLH